MLTICATASIVQGEPKTKGTKMEAEAAFDQALTPLQSRSDCEDEENAFADCTSDCKDEQYALHQCIQEIMDNGGIQDFDESLI